MQNPLANAARSKALEASVTASEMEAREANGRIVPNSFDPTEPGLGAVILPENYTWESAIETLRSFDARGVMMRLPLFWQTEPLLHAAVHAAGTYIFINDRGNMPVGALAIAEGIVDTVVTDFSDATAFASDLIERANRMPRGWVVVRSLAEAAIPLPLRLRDTNIVHEIHLVPGVPLLRQCAHLAPGNDADYHTANRFELTAASGGAIVNGNESAPLRLKNIQIPLSIEQAGICACGESIYHLNR